MVGLKTYREKKSPIHRNVECRIAQDGSDQYLLEKVKKNSFIDAKFFMTKFGKIVQ